MKKVSVFIALVLSCAVIIGAIAGEDISDNLIAVSIKQNGVIIPMENDTVTISRAPFEIIFTHRDPISFLVNASLTPQTYYLVDTDVELKNLPGFTQTGMAEGLRNDAFHITLSKDAPNAWMYSDKDVNRFDKVSVRRKSIECTRTIQNIRYGQELEKKIEDTDMDSIYLAFVEYEFDSDTYDSIQLSRLKLRIDFK